MNFFFQALLLFSFLFPVSLAQAQIKNECIGAEKDHLLLMEQMPGYRFFCVDARFLNDCRGPDNGKVTLVSSYSELNSLRGEFASSMSIFSKTDSQIKIAPGRIATAVKKKDQYKLFSGLEGYMRGTYLNTAKAVINGNKVEARRSGPIRQNIYLLDVSEKVARVLIDLEDPCQKESGQELYGDTKREGEKTGKQGISLSCELEDMERALSNLGDFETAVSGLDYKHRIVYAVLLNRRTEGVSFVELAFDKFCMPIETSLKDYIDVEKFLSKLDGPTVKKSFQGMERATKLMLRGMKK